MTLEQGIDRNWLREAAKVALTKGYAYLPGALHPSHVVAHLERASSAAWRPLVAADGPVTQCVEEHALLLSEPAARTVVDLFSSVFDIPDSWSPELTYLRYPRSHGYISPHKDHRRYLRIVSCLSLAGTTSFSIYHKNSRTQVAETWTVAPGDVVLLAGAASTGDPRPMHAVGGPGNSDRISLTLRFLNGAQPSET
ncbi:hypothetical protein [Kribbella ginsengisoli]